MLELIKAIQCQQSIVDMATLLQRLSQNVSARSQKLGLVSYRLSPIVSSYIQRIVRIFARSGAGVLRETARHGSVTHSIVSHCR